MTAPRTPQQLVNGRRLYDGCPSVLALRLITTCILELRCPHILRQERLVAASGIVRGLRISIVAPILAVLNQLGWVFR